jgi:hypothetical protein
MTLSMHYRIDPVTFGNAGKTQLRTGRIDDACAVASGSLARRPGATRRQGR